MTDVNLSLSKAHPGDSGVRYTWTFTTVAAQEGITKIKTSSRGVSWSSPRPASPSGAPSPAPASRATVDVDADGRVIGVTVAWVDDAENPPPAY